jgi:hypothetical protein
MTGEEYLVRVERELCGSRSARRRLLGELRDHLEDAAGEGVDDAVERLGAPGDVVAAWRAHVSATRARTRRRAAVLALTLTTTGALGVVQHASGHRAPRHACRTCGIGSVRTPTGGDHARRDRELRVRR